MKGNAKIIATLNDLLSDELTAINQYMVHSEMCDNWGYARLHKAVEKRAIDEMKHAEKLIARVLFLEGRPVVSKLKTVRIGPEVAAQVKNDWKAEEGAAGRTTRDRMCVELGDNGTREMLSRSGMRSRIDGSRRSSTRSTDGHGELPGRAGGRGLGVRTPLKPSVTSSPSRCGKVGFHGKR